MGLTFARKIRMICHNGWKLRFCVALQSAVALTGCNTCVTFTSNPPTGTVGIVSSDPRPACTLPKMTAAVRPQLAAEPVCSSCVGSGQVQRIFLTIRGIELNSSATARDDSPDWQELLPPDLEQKPLQLDLLESEADQTVPAPFGKIALVPAGVYRQLRLRLVPNHPAEDSRLPEKNACVAAEHSIASSRPTVPSTRLSSMTLLQNFASPQAKWMALLFAYFQIPTQI